ncbi:MAG: TipAS antibiotic-recognition domain-containing protein [Actinobacteria bacterium]|nr:TipAS antibiotic-recognition domain-containing protein [Actinomycetota bacterium]
MDWSIQEIARLAKTTSRTLRHYGELGLLEPSRIGSNGYRYYDQRALLRLQRILLLRDLGLGLAAIGEVLTHETDERQALRDHLDLLRQERTMLVRQIRSVEDTLAALERGEQLMAEDMFKGFDHAQYREEVEERWGEEAYARSGSWWRGMSGQERSAWMRCARQLGDDWLAAVSQGIAADSAEAQRLAQRQFDWLRSIPGTPGGGTTGPTKDYFVGLAEMYVTDERFAANYGGRAGAELVRDAMTVYADNVL